MKIVLLDARVKALILRKCKSCDISKSYTASTPLKCVLYLQSKEIRLHTSHYSFYWGWERLPPEIFPLQPPEQARKCCQVVGFQFLESPLYCEWDLGQHLAGCNSLLNYNIPPHSSVLSSHQPSNQSVVIITPFLLLRCWGEGFMLVYIELGVWRLTTMLTLSTFSPSLYLALVFILKIKSNQTWQDKIYIPSVSLYNRYHQSSISFIVNNKHPINKFIVKSSAFSTC